jgi:hypothetical protein
MGPVAKFLLFLLRRCPSVTVETNSRPTTPTDYSQVPDFIEDLQNEIPDDDLISPAQQRIHYLEFCLALGSTDEPPLER